MINKFIKQIPCIGFGTYLLEGEDAYLSVLHAIKTGYRLIDTAAVYGNEVEVGRAIKDSQIAREEIIVSTKLLAVKKGYQAAIDECYLSMKRLNVTYLDIYLIHWMPRNYEELLDTWRGFEELYRQGVCKVIGVCNITLYYLDRLMKDAIIKPMISQMECHPFLQQDVFIQYCKKNQITFMGYGLFAKGLVFRNEDLQNLAQKEETTIANLLISWSMSRGVITLVKSENKMRIMSNFTNNISISEDLKLNLKELNDGLKIYRDPENNPFVE